MDRTIGRMIMLLARKCQGYLGDALRSYDLTAAEEPFFMVLQNYKGITQEELSALIGVDRAATARAMRSLEEKGFLFRVQDPNDRRQNRVYPTEKAQQMWETVRQELLHFNTLMTQGLDSQTVELVYAALQQIEENFKAIARQKTDDRTGRENG